MLCRKKALTFFSTAILINKEYQDNEAHHLRYIEMRACRQVIEPHV